MHVYDTSLIRIYFGGHHDRLIEPGGGFLEPGFLDLQKQLGSDNLVFLKQVHGVAVRCADELATPAQPLHLFESTGDTIITTTAGVGVGVLTADCLPVVFHDPVHNAIAVVHAGWRGSVAGILQTTLQRMAFRYGSQSEDVWVYFGPSARVCCYEVGADFVKNLSVAPDFGTVLQTRNGRMFFNLPLFNRLRLHELGVPDEAVNEYYNTCTICSPAFHSYRRQGKAAGRQATIALLKSGL